MRTPANTGIDAESLQADVMRFMAIIAFCLIAILALVRNVEAPPASPETTAKAPVLEPAAPKPRPPEPIPPPVPTVTKPTLAKPQVKAAVIEPSSTEPVPKALLDPIDPAPLPDLPKAPAPAPELERVAQPQPAEPVPLVTKASPPSLAEAPAEPSPATPDEEEGLSLRFTSDQDFLRLVSRGEVGVYLFNSEKSYQLSRSYQLQTASPPRQLYEVMPETIPEAIERAVNQSLPNRAGLRWGLAMPGPIAQQISRYVNTVRSGELRIDRYGEVHHVAKR